MTDSLATPLRRLEQAFLALADERARLLADGQGAHALASRKAARDDLLRRYDGPLSATEVEQLLDALDAACAASLGRVSGAEAVS